MWKGISKILLILPLCLSMTSFIQGQNIKKVDKQKVIQTKKLPVIALAELQFDKDVRVRVRYQETTYFLNFEGHFKNTGNADANGVKMVVHIRKVKHPTRFGPISKSIIKTIGPVYWPKIAKKTTSILGFGSSIPHSVGKGKFSATLILDPDNTITEVREDNNQKVVYFVIK